jgi:predicted ATPase
MTLDATQKSSPAHEPIRLRELHIKNFRGIDELHVELSLPVTVFAGANGMGKTSILEAALICTGGLDLLADDARPFKQQIRAGADDFELRAVLDVCELATIFPESGVDGWISEDQLNRLLRPHDGAAEVMFHAADCDGGHGAVARLRSLDRPFRISDFPRYLPMNVLKPRLEYYSARREPGRVHALGLSTSAAPESSGNREQQRLRILKRLLINLWVNARLRGNAQDTPAAFERLNQTWSHFHPVSGSEFVVEMVSEDPAEAIFDVFLQNAEGQRIPVDALSSGEQALLLFALPLVVRKQPPDIFVIDEPEQHLHVQWQRLIVPFLCTLSPATQFIVATQSEEVLDSVLQSEQRLLLHSSDPRAVRQAQG